MSAETDTENHLNKGVLGDSTTPSITLLNRMLGTSPVPRMLTPFEIDLLRRSKAEVARIVRDVLAAEPP